MGRRSGDHDVGSAVLRISRAYAIATVEAVHAVENTVLRHGIRTPRS